MTTENTFDAREFRNTLGRFATGVTIVTAKDTDSGYVGSTASSFNSVSMDPPLILWSIDKNARSLESYQQAEHFVVNVLAADQVSLSNHFARQQPDKFAGVDYDLGSGGVPVLSGCSATFECETRFLYEGGDHVIIVGEVKAFAGSDRHSLLFHKGAYAVSEAHPFAATYPQDEDDGGDGFADNYLHYLVGRSFYQLRRKMEPMLKRLHVDELEFRVLASLSGRESCDLSQLSYYTVLSEQELQAPLQQLQQQGLIATRQSGDKHQVELTAAGNDKLEPLLAAARANEADALGRFNSTDARQIKRSLNKMIAWTG